MLNSTFLKAQVRYLNPAGYIVSFDSSWQSVPKSVYNNRVKSQLSLFGCDQSVKFDAYFQKKRKHVFAYPYVAMKNYFFVVNSKSDVRKFIHYYIDSLNALELICSFDDFKLNNNNKTAYYDTTKNFLLLTQSARFHEKNIIGLFAFYFNKNATSAIYSYFDSSDLPANYIEFLNTIYKVERKNTEVLVKEFDRQRNIGVTYYNSAKEKSREKNYLEAVKLYSLALDSYPVEDVFSKSEALYNRALNKRYLDDLNGAIADYTLAIKYRPNYYKAYNNRGFAKMTLGSFKEAIDDFDKVVLFDNYQSEFTGMAIGNRGIAKINSGKNGCSDLKEAIQLGNTNVTSLFEEKCK